MHLLNKDIWSVYLVRCSDGTLYCGISNDVLKRVLKHNSGNGAKYTKTRRPVVLIYQKKIGTMGEALKKERQIKKMNKKAKESLCLENRG